MNTSFKVFDFVSSPASPTVLDKFSLDAEVLDIGNKDCILTLSWLTANGFLVDTQERCVRNAISGLVIPCSIRWIPSVTVLDLDLQPLEDGEIVWIICATTRYSRYATCFSSQQAARLPEHKPWAREIHLQDPYAKIPTGAVYKTTWEEDEALQKYLDENLPAGKVRRSRSATGAPILFVGKKDESLSLVVDYKALNCLTIPNKVAAEHEWKTAFRIKKGLFEYIVMPFGLTNAPATFQEMMDTIFKHEEGCVWYMYDILIYGGQIEA